VQDVEPDGQPEIATNKRREESSLLEVGWYRPKRRVPTVRRDDFSFRRSMTIPEQSVITTMTYETIADVLADEVEDIGGFATGINLLVKEQKK
jgi:hypothetical protein